MLSTTLVLASTLASSWAFSLNSFEARAKNIRIDPDLHKRLYEKTAGAWGQTGYNNCGTSNSPSSMCQTAVLNSVMDFCLFAPPKKGPTIGDAEAYVVSWCTQEGHGTRTMPVGTIKSAHYIVTPHYVQISGTGDLTKINILRGDEGGELDPHGATNKGNPIGGLAYYNKGQSQSKEWSMFVSDNEFCFRACPTSDPNAWLWCNHIYDIEGCLWNHPGNYGSGFSECDADTTRFFPGHYIANGQTTVTSFHNGDAYTPPAQAPGKSSNCVSYPTIVAGSGTRTLKPTTTSNKPATTSTKPATTSSKPATTSSKPATTSKKPATSSTKPATTSKKPATTSTKPATTSTKPATTSKKPATTSKKPATTTKPAPKPTATKKCTKSGEWLDKNSAYNRTHKECRAVLAAYRAQKAATCPAGKDGKWLSKHTDYIKKHPACQSVLDAYLKNALTTRDVKVTMAPPKKAKPTKAATKTKKPKAKKVTCSKTGKWLSTHKGYVKKHTECQAALTAYLKKKKN